MKNELNIAFITRPTL